MQLPERQCRLLAHLADDPDGRLLAIQLGIDESTNEVVLSCMYATVSDPQLAADPRRQQVPELARGIDHNELRALAKDLAGDYGIPLRDAR